jgi:hypothetical protein
MRRRRIVEVKRQVVIGTQAAVDRVLAPCGWQINTSFIERLNLSLRQRVVAIRRRSASPCKSGDGLSHQLVLFQVYHNFVLSHASLRQALAEPIATNGSGSAKLWQPRSPAMAAGLTDHVWTLKEVLMFWVPPWPQPHPVGTYSADDQPHRGQLGVTLFPISIARTLRATLSTGFFDSARWSVRWLPASHPLPFWLQRFSLLRGSTITMAQVRLCFHCP